MCWEETKCISVLVLTTLTHNANLVKISECHIFHPKKMVKGYLLAFVFFGPKYWRFLIFTKFTPRVRTNKTNTGMHLVSQYRSQKLRSEPLIPNILHSITYTGLGCTNLNSHYLISVKVHVQYINLNGNICILSAMICYTIL